MENRVDIVEVAGDDRLLYYMIAHLAMSERAVAYNHGRAFMTSPSHRWFIAVKGDEAVGFLPLKSGGGRVVMGDYYVEDDRGEVLAALIAEALRTLRDGTEIEVRVQTRHVGHFLSKGFREVVSWRLFSKMAGRGARPDAEEPPGDGE